MDEPSGDIEVSVAALLAIEQPLLVDAWERGEDPEYLLVHPAVYQAVAEAKKGQAEDYWGAPLQLMGLTLVPSETTPIDRPALR